MKKEHAHNRLTLLILVSACVHAAFLYSTDTEFSVPSQDERHFAVQLKTIYPEPQQKNHKTQETQSENTPEPQKEALPGIIPAHQNAVQENVISSTEASNNIIRTALLSKIKTKFTKYFKYPKFAQRKGWQGKVDLSFYINKQGNISDINIENSSGYAILDQAAQESLAQVKHITITNWPFNYKKKFNLPVIYKLYEG